MPLLSMVATAVLELLYAMGLADFEEAVSLWQKGDGARARSLLAPYGKKNRKIVAFRLLSYLPGSLFDVAASIYYRLPKLFS